MGNNLDRMLWDLNRIKRTMDAITPGVVTDLERRSRYRATADSSPEDAGRRSSGSVSNPTMDAIVRKLSGENVSDPIFEAVKSFAQTLADMSDLVIKLENSRRFVVDVAEKAGVRATTSECQACSRTVENTRRDRTRSGYCSACFTAWTRAGKPYRQQFEMERIAKVESSKGKVPPE